MNSSDLLSLALDPARVFDAAGMEADPWQKEVLRSNHKRICLCCSRQAGKSTVVAGLAIHNAMFHAGSLTLLVSRSQRQSGEVFRKVIDFYNALQRPVKHVGESRATYLELENRSRIVSLPGKEANIRSYSSVSLLIIDEAARVADDLYRSVRPMMAVSKGRVVILSTPYGRRGFFYEATENKEDWETRFIPGTSIARIGPEFLAQELKELGRSWYRQEYECSFDSVQGLVYPDFPTCYVERCLGRPQKKVGGIDFGFNDPFAAVWGYLDQNDILWITNEHYKRQQTLPQAIAHLPREVYWYADPSGRADIEEMRCDGFVVWKAGPVTMAGIRPGIAAVTSRIETGRLKIDHLACPNLASEANLYTYGNPSERHGNLEVPLDENNHAMDALRYLVSRVDRRFVLRYARQQRSPKEVSKQKPPEPPPAPQGPRRLDIRDPSIWTTF